MKKHSASDYKLMEEWHREAGSNQYYIDWLQKRAASEGAPLDAIYLRPQDKSWVTVRDLSVVHPFRRKGEIKK